jgi:hypothetical protein
VCELEQPGPWLQLCMQIGQHTCTCAGVGHTCVHNGRVNTGGGQNTLPAVVGVLVWCTVASCCEESGSVKLNRESGFGYCLGSTATLDRAGGQAPFTATVTAAVDTVNAPGCTCGVSGIGVTLRETGATRHVFLPPCATRSSAPSQR